MVQDLREYYPEDPAYTEDRLLVARSVAHKSVAQAAIIHNPDIAFWSWDLPVMADRHRLLRIIPPTRNWRPWFAASIIVLFAFIFVVPLLDPASTLLQMSATGIATVSPWLVRASRTFLDPLLMQGLGGLIILGLTFRLAKATGAPLVASLVGVFVFLLMALALQSVVDRFVFKPSLAIPRPESFDIANESFIMRLVHELVGEGGDAPSGSVGRQVILACIAAWIACHPELVLRRVLKVITMASAFFLVLVTMMLRLLVSAHSTEGILVGVGSGILEFWAVAVLARSLADDDDQETHHLLVSFTQVWSGLMVGWFLMSPDKLAFGLWMAFSIVILLAWSKYARYCSGGLLRRVLPDPVERSSWRRYTHDNGKMFIIVS